MKMPRKKKNPPVKRTRKNSVIESGGVDELLHTSDFIALSTSDWGNNCGSMSRIPDIYSPSSSALSPQSAWETRPTNPGFLVRDLGNSFNMVYDTAGMHSSPLSTLIHGQALQIETAQAGNSIISQRHALGSVLAPTEMCPPLSSVISSQSAWETGPPYHGFVISDGRNSFNMVSGIAEMHPSSLSTLTHRQAWLTELPHIGNSIISRRDALSSVLGIPEICSSLSSVLPSQSARLAGPTYHNFLIADGRNSFNTVSGIDEMHSSSLSTLPHRQAWLTELTHVGNSITSRRNTLASVSSTPEICHPLSNAFLYQPAWVTEPTYPGILRVEQRDGFNMVSGIAEIHSPLLSTLAYQSAGQIESAHVRSWMTGKGINLDYLSEFSKVHDPITDILSYRTEWETRAQLRASTDVRQFSTDQATWASMFERLKDENTFYKLLTYGNGVSVSEYRNGNQYTLTVVFNVQINGDYNIVGNRNQQNINISYLHNEKC